MRLLALLFKGSYQIHRHEWAGVRLDRWMILLLLIAAGLFAVGVLPGRLAGVIACSVLLLAMIIVVNVAARRQFVVFNRDGSSVLQSLSARFMDPMDKLSLRATGLFEVEGRAGRFTDIQGTYRSFQTREHSIMAIVPPSRALLVGRWPDEEIGMWYIFFKGTEIRRIEPGQLCFGRHSRLAVQIDLEQVILPPTSPIDVWGGYRSGKQKRKLRQQTIYFSFDSPSDRQTVLADLLMDAQTASSP